jgi:hypothetical protein
VAGEQEEEHPRVRESGSRLRDSTGRPESDSTATGDATSSSSSGKQELVIDDAPSLERLVFPRGLDGEAITVNRAPKLQILGPLSPCISKLEIAELVFQVAHQLYFIITYAFSIQRCIILFTYNDSFRVWSQKA